jgi:predicted  nucleic acid-binding Zn-ribbon protein
MNPDLERIVRLQDADDALRAAETELEAVPRERAALDARLDEERRRLDTARQELDGCQSQRRKHEGELQDLEEKRSKYKSQLMEVKTNKEYTAMLHEIEAVERQISDIEDRILEALEGAEGLAETVKREESAFAEVEAVHRSEGEVLDRRQHEAEERAARLRKERDEAAAKLSEAHRELYQRVAKLRGAAVTAASDGMCQGCHVKLRPQMFVDVRQNQKIVQCPSCSRVLYYEPPPPVEVPPEA